jgi:uncharacterized protein YndB with AHSA1/START domain
MNIPDRLTLTFPSERETVITRVFAAPRRLVFAAITQPEHVRHWYGPRSLTMKSCEIDLRVGGKWRYVVQAPDGSEFAFSGVYQEIVAPERIVSTELFEAMPGTDYLATVTLHEQEGKTIFTNHLRYQSQEHRDGHLHAGMEGGMGESFERLDEALATLVAEHSAWAATQIKIVVTRHFDSPAELVFDAWLDPKAVGHWLFATPTGEMKRVEIDARVGGEFVIAEQRGDILAEHFGRYVEIERPWRLVFNFSAERRDEPNPSQVTVEIEPKANGCELRLTHCIDAQWAAYADRTRGGWTMILDGLNNTITADRQIVITRLYDAPRELVWQSWTEPEHVAHWWGPDGFSLTIHEMDVRPGGLWNFYMHGPDGTAYLNHIVYVEVTKPERLVYDHSPTPRFQSTVTFSQQGDRTAVTMRSIFATTEDYARAIHLFHAVEGGQQTLGRLGNYLAGLTKYNR